MKPDTPSSPRCLPRLLEPLLALLLVAQGVLLFHFQGNASYVAAESSSVFAWIWHDWTRQGSEFTHAWLMPLISLYFVWRSRREWRAAPRAVSLAGLALTVAALALHLLAMRVQQPRISLVALTGLLLGVPWFLFGPAVARHLLFPCAYLLLCVLSYLLVNVTFPLRLFASAAAEALLNGLGVPAMRTGTAIYTSAGGGLLFDVADPCSGLRSLVVLTAIAAPYAYLAPLPGFGRWILFLAAIPIAVTANIARIVGIGLAAAALGRDVALHLYHDYSGYFVFIFATLLLVGVGELLRRWLSK